MKQRYIDINETILKVLDYNEDDFSPKKGEAYIKGKFVFPYRGKYKENDKKKKVGVYLNKDGYPIFIKPFNKNKRNTYSVSNIYKIELNSIKSIIEYEGVLDPDVNVIMGETDDVFAPLITEDDNALQILIKEALRDKQIDLKHYKNRFVDGSKMSNCKGAMFKHGKMSLEKFLIWADVLDLEVTISIKDKKGCMNPMNNTHTYCNYKK